jgi:hypothetical protein
MDALTWYESRLSTLTPRRESDRKAWEEKCEALKSIEGTFCLRGSDNLFRVNNAKTYIEPFNRRCPDVADAQLLIETTADGVKWYPFTAMPYSKFLTVRRPGE